MEIHESMQQILQAKDELGVMFYDHFLSQYPELQKYFQYVDLKRMAIRSYLTLCICLTPTH